MTERKVGGYTGSTPAADVPSVPVCQPLTEPSDKRQECQACGKWVWLDWHSCQGVPVTEAALWRRIDNLTEINGDLRRELAYVEAQNAAALALCDESEAASDEVRATSHPHDRVDALLYVADVRRALGGEPDA